MSPTPPSLPVVASLNIRPFHENQNFARLNISLATPLAFARGHTAAVQPILAFHARLSVPLIATTVIDQIWKKGAASICSKSLTEAFCKAPNVAAATYGIMRW